MSIPSITSLAFLTPGNFADEDPYTGLEETLQLFEYGERIGFDGAWVRQRHLEHGVGSAAVFLAAAGQRTERVELGTAVIPIGYESPFRLAEDLALADVLSRGRLQAGFSTGMPHAELLGDLVYDGDWRGFDLSYGRIARVVDNLRGDYLGGPDTVIQSPGNTQRPRLQPHDPGLLDRVWYGGGSLRSIRWAAEHGLNLLSGNIVTGEGTDDFTTAQLTLLSEYRRTVSAARPARVALGRVIVPFDSADAGDPGPVPGVRGRPARAHPGAAGQEPDAVRAGRGRDGGADPGATGRGSRGLGRVGVAPGAAVRVPSGRLRADPARRPACDRAGAGLAARRCGHSGRPGARTAPALTAPGRAAGRHPGRRRSMSGPGQERYGQSSRRMSPRTR